MIDEDDFFITRHASFRMKKRLGINKKSRRKAAVNAWVKGCRHKDFQAGQMRKYLDAIFLRDRTIDQLRVYAEHVWLFRGKTLITVIRIPNNLRRQSVA